MRRFFLIFVGVAVADQVSKLAVLAAGWPVVWNRGFSWGVPAGEIWLPAGIAGAILVGIFWHFYREKIWPGAAWAAVLGGGAANLADRFFRPGVADWIHPGFFPSFNLADAAITVGAAILILENFPAIRRALGIRGKF